MLDALAVPTGRQYVQRVSIHSLRRGLPRCQIEFATHAFAFQRQLMLGLRFRLLDVPPTIVEFYLSCWNTKTLHLTQVLPFLKLFSAQTKHLT